MQIESNVSASFCILLFFLLALSLFQIFIIFNFLKSKYFLSKLFRCDVLRHGLLILSFACQNVKVFL
jgi:hypothetical protein